MDPAYCKFAPICLRFGKNHPSTFSVNRYYVVIAVPVHRAYFDITIWMRTLQRRVKPVVTISLCMIVKNEEHTVGRCLQSVYHLVDEIVIIDTGSTDKTKEECRRFGARVYDFEWIDDFSAARNYAFAQGTKDYILWLDADDVLSEADQEKFQKLKETLTADVDAVSMEYELAFGPEGEATYSLRRHRLVKRTAGFRWIGAVHEYLAVQGNVIHSDVAVQHRPVSYDPNRNIRIYENMLVQGKTFSPRDLYYYANELKDHARYEEAIEHYEKFFATGQGWVEDVITACNKMSECYHRLGNERMELQSVLRSFQYDYPRAEACCRIGHVFFRRGDYRTAIFWYSAAIASVNVKPDEVRMFQNTAYATWVPHLQLCVCYDRIGSPLLAYMHNEQAAKYIPQDERVSRNRAYLEPLAQNEKEALQKKMASHFPQTIQVGNLAEDEAARGANVSGDGALESGLTAKQKVRRRRRRR